MDFFSYARLSFHLVKLW
ncbi:hypothetical protein OYC64_004449 [Pagothenia borchgrevinki]|uniref:Uncharacterized protein n=1 Tax=Pagothenia borchgrevinki TaxID=8213 RepID=A0ABD2FXN1_PAGBO